MHFFGGSKQAGNINRKNGELIEMLEKLHARGQTTSYVTHQRAYRQSVAAAAAWSWRTASSLPTGNQTKRAT